MNDPRYKIATFKGHVPAEYEGLLYSNWLRTFRYGNDMIKMIEPHAYYDNYKPVIRLILEHPDTETRIAVLNGDEDVAFGFSVSRGTTLHYVYVPKQGRNEGLCTALIRPETMLTFTHITRHWMLFRSTKNYLHMQYNPWS